MHFMNRWEIDEQAARHCNHKVLGPATRFLQHFRDLIDSNSDGWAYWGPPVHGAKRLMLLIQNPETATEATFKKALTPIKTFCTRHKLPMPIVEEPSREAPAEKPVTRLSTDAQQELFSPGVRLHSTEAKLLSTKLAARTPDTDTYAKAFDEPACPEASAIGPSMTVGKAWKIAALNDFARKAMGVACRVYQTPGISALPAQDQSAIREKVETFDAFTPDNDPYREHDFGGFEHNGEKVLWKIDYYDRTMTKGSEEPSDPRQTARVLTIMLACEY